MPLAGPPAGTGVTSIGSDSLSSALQSALERVDGPPRPAGARGGPAAGGAPPSNANNRHMQSGGVDGGPSGPPLPRGGGREQLMEPRRERRNSRPPLGGTVHLPGQNAARRASLRSEGRRREGSLGGRFSVGDEDPGELIDSRSGEVARREDHVASPVRTRAGGRSNADQYVRQESAGPRERGSSAKRSYRATPTRGETHAPDRVMSQSNVRVASMPPPEEEGESAFVGRASRKRVGAICGFWKELDFSRCGAPKPEGNADYSKFP